MTELIASRRASSSQRLGALQKQLAEAERLAGGVACIYVTGSYGRAEAGDYSDVDAFIVGENDREKKRALSKLDEILMKAELIKACQALSFPEFDRDGDFLNHHSIDHLVDTLGKPEDDAENTFTARLLLLLESQPLVGSEVYDRVVGRVIDAYWRDYAKHESDFMPMYLANDILRMWRTFCINYEARTKSEPAEKLAKRKVKNYKLKHSRLLTCYSAVAYLLTVHKQHKTVRPDDARNMVKLTPTERLEWIRSAEEDSKDHVDKILERYASFLDNTNVEPAKLRDAFKESETAEPFTSVDDQLGISMYGLLKQIGSDSDFFRLLVV